MVLTEPLSNYTNGYLFIDNGVTTASTSNIPELCTKL